MFILKNLKEQVTLNPQKTAVISENKHLSFEEVDNFSDHIANKISKCNLNSIVAFSVDDNFHVLPIVLGILKSGCTPMPLIKDLEIDKSLERVADVNFNVVITDFIPESMREDVNFLVLDDEPDLSKMSTIDFVKKAPEIAYIICTSGTTGRPKKVFITKENLKWLLETFYPMVNFDNKSHFLFTTPYTFDVSLTEIFAPILTGGVLVCFKSSIQNIKNLGDIIQKSSITHLSISPTLADLTLDTGGKKIFSSLKYLCIAGENFPKSLGDKLKFTISNGCRVFNLYGPSETTVYATGYELTGNEREVIPIGRPLEGVNIKVISEKGEEVRSGELCIGGMGVTNGYLLQPDLNSEKFHTINDERYYLTGDFVHFNSKNELVYEGRRDDQVQINGIRIELDEIISIVLGVKGVTSSQVSYKNKKLYIFYIALQDLKEEILRNLPTYLHPIIVKVDKYILNSNRKLNVIKMIDRYYLTKDNSLEKEKFEYKIQSILLEYGFTQIQDLDSLDMVRFFVDIEDEFSVEIKAEDMVSLSNFNNLVSYIKKSNVSDDKKKTEVKSIINNHSSDILNLRILLSIVKFYYENKTIPLSCTQKKLSTRKMMPLVNFEFAMDDINFRDIIKLKRVMKNLSEKIDILKMIVRATDEGIAFHYLTNKSINPIILAFDDFLTDEEITLVLMEQKILPIPLTIISIKQKKARVYFPYHSIDGSSLGMLERIFNASYIDEKYIESIEQSSFAEFMDFMSECNSTPNYSKLLELTPETSGELELIKSNNDIFISSFYLIPKNTLEIISYTVYWVGQCIFDDYKFNNLTAQISYNFRNYDSFNAKNIIGDVHTKIPMEVIAGESYYSFLDRFRQILQQYQTGGDIRYCVFDENNNDLRLKRELTDRWHALNLSFNYIGEIKDIPKLIADLKRIPFGNSSITMFSQRGKIYVALRGNLFKKGSYTFFNSFDEIEIVTEKF